MEIFPLIDPYALRQDGSKPLTANWNAGAYDITTAGTVQGGTLTDGTLSINSGSITNGVNGTFSGTVTVDTFTDSTITITNGVVTSSSDLILRGQTTGGQFAVGDGVFYPAIDNSYDLGKTDKRFQDIFYGTKIENPGIIKIYNDVKDTIIDGDPASAEDRTLLLEIGGVSLMAMGVGATGGASSSIDIGNVLGTNYAYGSWNFGSTVAVTGALSAPSLTLSPSGATTTQIETTSTAGNPVLTLYNPAVPGVVFIARRARGTSGTPDFLNLNDTIFTFNPQVWDGDDFGVNVGQFVFQAAQHHSAGNLGTKFAVKVTPNGEIGGAGTMVTPLVADGTNGTRMGDGGTTNYAEVSLTGDLVFVGSAGLSHGSCYGNHIGWSQAAAVQNTWYNISDADMLDGILHNVTHDGNGKLTVAKAGMYRIGYSVCFEDNVANDHIEIGIEVSGSGSANAAGQVHLENKFASEEEHSGSSAILDLAANATIEAAIRTTDAGTPTISVQSVNITCVQVGGT